MSSYKLSFRRNLSFANASPRYVINPVTGAVTGPYAAGTPAIVSIGGERYLQVERSEDNNVIQSVSKSGWIQNRILSFNPTTDPLGGSTAAIMIPAINGLDHTMYKSTASGTRLVTSAFFGAAGYGYALIWCTAGAYNTIVICNLSTLSCTAVLNEGSRFVSANAIALAGGWVRLQVVTTTANSYVDVGISSDGVNYNFTGDGVNGIKIWNTQSSSWTLYNGSPILTTTTAVTRAKDEAFIPSARVSTALRDRMQASVYPEWSSSQVTTGDKRYFFEHADTTQNIGCYYDGADKKVNVAGRVNTLASGINNPHDLVHDATNVYYVAYVTGTVTKINKSTGVITNLVTGLTNVYCLCVDSTTVYWIDGGSSGRVCSVPIAGGAVTVLATGEGTVYFSIACDATTLYWASYSNRRIRSTLKAGGSVTTLVTVTDRPYKIVVDGANVYCCTDEGTTDGLFSVPKAGGVRTVLDINGNKALALYGSYLYYTTAAGKVFKIATTGGTPVELVSSGAVPTYCALYCDGVRVYYVGPTTTVMYVPIGGGSAVAITPTGMGVIQALSVDTTTVYLPLHSTSVVSSIFKAPFATSATTHSAGQKLTVVADRVAGTVTLSGFTTGNGVYTGTPWVSPNGNLYIGMDADLANQMDGLIAEPGMPS